jgi:hypothetical protein
MSVWTCVICGDPVEPGTRCPECEEKLYGCEADDEDSYCAAELKRQLTAEREVRRRLREWLEEVSATDCRTSVREFCISGLAKMGEIERGALGEEK